MGYYPTPLSVVDRIGSFLEFPGENANLLDPCCGEGIALRALAERGKATTYGVELDQYRAEVAGSNLDKVLHCSYEDARVSNGAFSCLFLNPPYDWAERADQAERAERKEAAFLRGTVRYLQPDGVLVYIVPQQRVRSDTARFLAHRFGELDVYRFMDEEYEPYRQVVVFGVRKPKGALDEAGLDRLSGLAYEPLLELSYAERPVYTLPPSHDVRLFRSTAIDEGELERELGRSPLWSRMAVRAAGNERSIGRPPLPLHAGHLGLLLASGHLDGVVGDGEDRHVVRGKVEKKTHTYQEHQGETLVEREVERYQVSIKVLRRDGRIVTLM